MAFMEEGLVVEAVSFSLSDEKKNNR